MSRLISEWVCMLFFVVGFWRVGDLNHFQQFLVISSLICFDVHVLVMKTDESI